MQHEMFEESKNTVNSIYWSHILVLFLGGVIGLVVAYFFNSINFDFSGEIKEARDLGIVSLTILKGYASTRDILTYVSVLGFPVFFSIGLWLLWAKRERWGLLAEILPEDNGDWEKKVGWFFIISIVMAYFLFNAFSLNFFYGPGSNPLVGSWPFLGEEGQNLAWVQSIFSGGVYGKDFFSPYGPMLVYPLAWTMKLLGTTVLVERIYSYILNFFSYSIILFFLYRTLLD